MSGRSPRPPSSTNGTPGQFPVYADDTDADADIESASELVSTGTVPAIVGSAWELDSNGDMETFINTNLLGLSTSNPTRGRVAFRGPYLGSINEDPWGQAYVINALNLLRGSGNIGFAISAGPDGNLDTDRDQTGSLTVTGDDLVVRIK